MNCDMEITKETKLSDLLDQYPWLKEELSKVNDKFKMLNTPIGYEGTDHPIKAGENFHFAKAGLHSVKAIKRFKMALLLTLE